MLEKVFINKSKIHFESKSQLVGESVDITEWCLSISQRYILKANHNGTVRDYIKEAGVYQ